ncbi:hypothetical protein QBC37DRAFT_400069 [Rhypophila decipiens]|uniref:Uncharacterized protein n=1 Tax=Rhypophila decipiens TaxID=261697 RepID=A0AAN7BAI1_9PEZI|nr:hypothetical protein QBC37DRAFT_400069 [Rhypophila decipiens]
MLCFSSVRTGLSTECGSHSLLLPDWPLRRTGREPAEFGRYDRSQRTELGTYDRTGHGRQVMSVAQPTRLLIPLRRFGEPGWAYPKISGLAHISTLPSPCRFGSTAVAGAVTPSYCMESAKISSSPSYNAKSSEFMGVGSTFDFPAPFDQHRLSDNEVYGTNVVLDTNQFYRSPCYSTDRPLFSWDNNLGQDTDIRSCNCSERTASLTTARTIISDGDPDFTAAETPPSKNGAAEYQNLFPAQSVTPDLAPAILYAAQPAGSAHHSTEAFLCWDGNLEQKLLWVAMICLGIVFQLETGENQHKPGGANPKTQQKKETASTETERCGGTASSHQMKSSISGNKRKAGPAKDDHPDSGDQKSDRVRRSKTTQLLWACLFAKADPWKHPKCLLAGQDKISYVKQHLYRIHGPVYCRICGKQFPESQSTDGQSAESLRDSHENENACQSRTTTSEGRMTYDQAKAVKEAKSRDVSDPERWFQLFEIVCPGYPRPDSPYARPATIEILGSFRDNLRREIGQRAVRAAAASALTDGHQVEMYIRLVEETVSNFVRRLERLEEHEDDNNAVDQNPNLDPDLHQVLVTPELTVSPLVLTRAPEQVYSESSTASTISAVGSSISDRVGDFNTTTGPFTNKGRYEFHAGVQDLCEGGQAPSEHHNTSPAPLYASAVHPGVSLDADQEASIFNDNLQAMFGEELFGSPEPTQAPGVDDPNDWSTQS